jgi:hypothetical protein
MKTALQRLQENALDQLSRLERLRYLASAREPDGQYSHWGLAKMYGEATLQQAMSEIHSSVFVDVLSTPIGQLDDEMSRGAREGGVASEGYVKTLSEKFKAASPENCLGGCEEHLKMILYALSCLARRNCRPA